MILFLVRCPSLTLHRVLYTGAQAHCGSYVLCQAAPPTAVGGAHNSPIANAIMTLKSGLVHIYITRVGSFTSPGIDTRKKGPTIFSVLSEKTRAISGKVFCPGTQAHVTDRPGFKRTTLGSSVRLANHPATAVCSDNGWLAATSTYWAADGRCAAAGREAPCSGPLPSAPPTGGSQTPASPSCVRPAG